MSKLNLIIRPEAETVFAKYPAKVREKMLKLRELVIETARETQELEQLEVTLKWGEPSFVTPQGSTLRMDWKERSPDHYAMYFQCTSRLVDTFRLVFDKTFSYEGNRALVFTINHKLPVKELKECIKASLLYHEVKHSETLGIE